MYSRYGKPLLKEYFNIFFSISHCKSGCVVAFMKLVGIGMIPDLQFLSIVIVGNWREPIFLKHAYLSGMQQVEKSIFMIF